MLLGVDESLGRIRQTLGEMGELERTVIILTSDHGYFYGEHGLNDERGLAYEETARIPLIVRYPPLAVAGATPTPMVQTIDLAPTILELAGVADTVKRQGVSLVRLLRGENPPWRTSVLIEYYSDSVFPRWGTWRCEPNATSTSTTSRRRMDAPEQHGCLRWVRAPAAPLAGRQPD